jgi:hypothetical protein
LIEVGEVDVVNGAVVERSKALWVFIAIALFLIIVILGLFLRVSASTFDSLEWEQKYTCDVLAPSFARTHHIGLVFIQPS